MKTKLLILSHSRTVPHICKLANVLEKLSISFDICHGSAGDTYPVDTSSYTGLIIMGGEMGIYDAPSLPWLQQEIEFVRSFCTTSKPVLGICLGCQMLAHIYGGDVYVGEKGMNVGFKNLQILTHDPVFGDELKGAKVMAWQGDTYTIADTATQLAKGCFYEQQAVKFADKVYGVQFHPETMTETIERWYGRLGCAHQFPNDAPEKDALLADAHKYLPQAHLWLEKFLERLFVQVL